MDGNTVTGEVEGVAKLREAKRLGMPSNKQLLEAVTACITKLPVYDPRMLFG